MTSAATVTITPRRFTLRRPLVSAWGELRERTVYEVSVEHDGLVGRGEACALEPYDGVSDAALLAALERGDRTLPQARAAFDLAGWDLRAQRGEALPPLPDRIPASALGVEPGYRCVKVKVGLDDDAERLAAVRAQIGPHVALRIDANGAWRRPDDALRALERLAAFDIELCEEPVHGVERLERLRGRTPMPIAMDETYAPTSGCADLICLKISRCGGITGVLDAAQAARAAGTGVYLASTFDGPIGIAAGLRAAGLVGVDAPCGLATLAWFAECPVVLPLADGSLPVPAWSAGPFGSG